MFGVSATTVSSVEPAVPTDGVALMVVVPAATPVANPPVVMVAFAVSKDDQVTLVVTS